MANTATATTTDVIEMTELRPAEPATIPNQNGTTFDLQEGPPADTDVAGASPLKLASAAFSFFVAGVNDGSIGALVPFLIRSYEISAATVSGIYAASFFGWLFAAVTNTHLCQYLDLGAMLALGALCQTLAHTLRAWGPPFGLFVSTFWLVSLGQAYQDTHANTLVASVPKSAHSWLGLIHAMYMAGCLTGPLVATAVAASSEAAATRWYLFYTVPLGLGLSNLALTLFAFRGSLRLLPSDSTAGPSRVQGHEAPGGGTETTSSSIGDPADAHVTSRNEGALKLIRDTVRTPSMWLLSLFYFFYLGAAITAGGWVVEYLVDVRGGDLSRMGYVSAGYSGGGLLGRLLLPEPTFQFGERRMIFIYCMLCIGLQLLFWLVPNIIAASIAVSFLGFFSGPLFATGVSVGSKLFAPEIRSTALAFVFVFAQMGGSIFPVATGVLASHNGVAVLQPMLVGLLGATAIAWLLIPQPKSTSNPTLHQE